MSETEGSTTVGLQQIRGSRKARVFVGLFVVSYIIGLVTTVYFAVVKSTKGNTLPRKEYSLEDLRRLELEIADRFRFYHCNDGRKNSFKFYHGDNHTRYCYYVFTDHQSKWYIENGCKFFWGDYLRGLRKDLYGFSDIAADFKLCCLNYFRVRDLSWWNSLPVDEKRITFTRPSLSYELHVYKNCGIKPNEPEFGSLLTKCNCSWGEFDPYWKSLGCTYQPSHSHVCLYTEYATVDINDQPWLETQTESTGGGFG